MEDDLTLPAFLKREKGETKFEKPDLNAPRVWAPIKTASEIRKREQKPVFADHPEYEVQVNVENDGKPTSIAIYDNFDEFKAEHNFEGHPIKRIATLGEQTIVLVGGHIVKSADPNVADRVVARTPRSNKIQVYIWARAEQLWTAAGSPMDIKVILKLRREWMKILQKEGINKSTCSCEFGNWQKFKLSGK